MSVPDHADVVKTPRPDADAMDTGGSLSHLSHLSHVPRQPHERVPHAHRTVGRPAQRAHPAGGRRAAGGQRPARRPRTRCAPRSARRPCTASSSPPSGPGRCGAAPGRRSRRSRRPGSRRRRVAASGGPTCWSPAPTSRPSTCSASPGSRATAPADLTVLVRTHGAPGLDRLDRAGRHRHTGRQRGQGGPARHRAALGRRLRRLPGPGRRASAARCRAACGSTWSTRAARTPTRRSAGRPADAVGAGRGAPSRRSSPAAQWGADESIRGSAPKYNATIKAGFVHHTAGANGYSEAEVPKILRGIYAYHVKGNGWSDIGYNFLVDRFGRLWEGRYGGMTRAVARRAHRRLQRRQLRGVGDRQLRQGRGARGDGRLDRPADGLEAVAVLPRPERHDGAHVPGRRDLEVPRRHQGHLQRDLRAPRRRQHRLPGHQPLHPARRPSGR